MAAQTVTKRLGKSTIQKLSNLQHEIRSAAPTSIDANTTTTLTLVYTTSTGAITLDESTT